MEQDETPASREGDLVRPSLQLHEFEGRVHLYEGMLSQRTKLKKWKRRWFRVAPSRRQDHIFYLTQSKSTKQKKSEMEKRIITIPKLSPNLLTEPISTDPSSEMFTAFNVYDSQTKELLGTFRADDIVQQRNFMVALSGKGCGLFTQHSDNALDEPVQEPAASDSHEYGGSGRRELLLRQQSYDRMSNLSLKGQFEPPSYTATMASMSTEYYGFDGNCSADEELRKFPGQLLPVYDAANLPTTGTIKPMQRREYEDKFLPPHGPPVHNPVSIGYGSEVGLKDHQQALWDPSHDVYYFVDHSTKTLFLDDPRPLEPKKPVITKNEISCKDVQNSHQLPQVFTQSGILSGTLDEVPSQKPIGLVLNAVGSHGSSGSKGQNGKKGQSGHSGGIGTYGSGEDGDNGINGDHARNGSTGNPGQDGGNLTITLKGSVSELHIDINDHSIASIMNLGDERCDEVVLVNCRGGNGGDGGEGGSGGAGGAGGDGGDGTSKGDGGHGGDGGMGGDGGAGGNGGSAGNGGHCVIQASDPSLLMLVEADCRAGIHGVGAQGGRGGEGGAGGFGGNGASWQEADMNSGKYTLKTVTGMRGKPGMTGSAGMSGTAGSDGSKGVNGGVIWMITSENGDILHQARKRYELEVTDYDVKPENNDVYEPNQRITVSNVTVVNTGGLPLPAGAKVFFPSNETVRFEPTVYVLPQLTPNQSFTVPVTFEGRICDQTTPNSPGPLNVQAHVSSKINFLGRSFQKSVLTKPLPVSYPVKLSFALSRKTMSCGEISTLDIGIENISQLSCGSSGTDTGGSVYLRVHMDPRLLPLGIYSQVSHASVPYAINYDPTIPDSMFIHIHEIQPGETLIIPVLVQMESQAELCDSCVWQVDLYSRGKLIEYKSQAIRVSPAYTPPSDPAQTGDLLMIINKKLKREQFVLLQRIFSILSINVDYWDSSQRKNSGSTSPEVDSSESFQEESERKLKQLFHTYRGRAILYPHFHYQDIPGDDIVKYLKSGNERDSSCDCNSSVLLFHSSTFPESLEDYHLHQLGNIQLLQYLCSSEKQLSIPQSSYSGHHILPPGKLVSTDCMIKRSTKNVVRKLEQDEPSQTVVVMKHTRAIQHKKALHYSYGTLDVRRCPLLRSCNFQFVDGAAGSVMSMGSDDPLLTPSSREFPLASKFGQVFLAVMYAIPLRCKLAILKKSEKKSSPNFVRFHLPNGLTFIKQELAAICIARVVADEVLNCSGSVSRMQYVLSNLEDGKKLSTEKDTVEIISKMLELIKTEVVERKKVMPLPTVVKTSKEIQQLCCLNSFCKKSNSLKKLPQLKLLQDSTNVLRSHQLTSVDDDLYHYVTSAS